MLKVGVVGLRRGMSLMRVFALHKDVQLVAACDLDEKRAENVKKEMGLESVYTDYEDFLSHEMDVVIVASPMPLHVSHSIAALKSDFLMIKYAITMFFIDILIRVLINPKYSPFLETMSKVTAVPKSTNINPGPNNFKPA